MLKKTISSGTSWEKNFGYSRVVIIGSSIHIAGTTSVDSSGNIIGKNNPYEQTKYILHKIKKILEENGFNIIDVIRTRMYVTNIAYCDDIGKAHFEYFKDVLPVSTMIEINNLIDSELLVEIEAEGIKI